MGSADEYSYTPLSFKIPEDVKRQAMLASDSTGASFWQHTLYRGPNDERVKVHYCRSRETTERVAQMFLNQKLLGFDIEWKAQALAREGIKKNVSLIQIAAEERIALFHVALFGKDDCVDDFVAPTLKYIMESPDITKVGVAIKADCTRMRNFLNIDSRGLFELSHLYKLVKYSTDANKINKRLVSLAQQVEEHLQLPMRKGEVRSSDWSRELGRQQIDYAASDSYAGLHLFDVLEAKRKALTPTPPRPALAELNLPIRLADGHVIPTVDEQQEPSDEPLDQSSKAPLYPILPPTSPEDITISFSRLSTTDDDPSTDNVSLTQDISSPTLFTVADDWARTHLDTTTRAGPRASPAFLRAYFLWHHHAQSVQEAAASLRQPPLQPSTVVEYILRAVAREQLDVDQTRLGEVLDMVPEGARGRYRVMLKRMLDREPRSASPGHEESAAASPVHGGWHGN